MSISRKTAPATDSTQTKIVTTTVMLVGASRPNDPNSSASQNTMTAKKGSGRPSARVSTSIQCSSASSLVISSARPTSQRWLSVVGVSARSSSCMGSTPRSWMMRLVAPLSSSVSAHGVASRVSTSSRRILRASAVSGP